MKLRILAACWAFGLTGAASAQTGTNPCNDTLLRAIPERPAAALAGSAVARRVEPVSEHDREAAIESEILSGNIPAFLRRLMPVSLGSAAPNGRTLQTIICVLPDYLAVGSNADYLFVPMRLATALTIAGRYGFTLPTTKMVDAIYEQSAVRLAPQPLPPGEQMRSIDYYWRHSRIIRQQQEALGVQPGELTAGDKKDIVITKHLWQNLGRVAIYGWHQMDHKPIQPLTTVHGARYADYSHGVRLVSTVIFVNGERRSMFDALADTQLAPALNGEGAIQRVTELLATLAKPPAEAATASTYTASRSNE